MAQQQLSNGISGAVFRKILNDNFTELYNDKATKSHASADGTFGLASTTMFGHIKVTNGNGLSVNNGVLSLAAATTSQAKAGGATDVVMTPARVMDAMWGFGVISDGNIILKVGEYQPIKQEGKTVIWIDTSS